MAMIEVSGINEMIKRKKTNKMMKLETNKKRRDKLGQYCIKKVKNKFANDVAPATATSV